MTENTLSDSDSDSDTCNIRDCNICKMDQENE